jgi:hypothetical protein
MSPRKDASPYPAGWRLCAWCRCSKLFRSGRRYCGPRCAAFGRTVTMAEGRLQAQAARASAAAAAAREADVLAKVAGLTPVEAYRYGRDLGYAQGWNSATYRARRGVA